MICTIDDCESVAVARGWCKIHYYRWHRNGDPVLVKPPGLPAKPRAICKFPDCEIVSKRGARGWCGKHYTRWFRHGDPSVDGNKNRRRKDVMARIRERIVVSDGGCWIWQGTMLPNGYGQMSVRHRHSYPHREAWAYINGPIPAGLQIHHDCLQRACCNPDHLRLLTPQEHSAVHKKEQVA